jgi:hypothetical protein
MPKAAQKRPNKSSRRPARKVARKAVSSPAPAGLMRIAAPPAQPWNLTQDEVGLIKNHVAKGATDEELKFCLAVARRRKLDPFKQQIWFVKRRDKSAEGGARWVPMTSIDGLLHVAARDHKDFGSSDEPVFGPLKEIKWNYFEKSGKFMAPESATVAVWKKGATRSTVCTVYWDEIYPDAGASPMVREKPRLMLGKCALAQCIRRAYPDTGGLYIPEEFQGPPEFTPQGREIVEAAKPPAEQAYLDREQEQLKLLTPDQREVVERKMKEAEARKAAPPIDIQPPRTDNAAQNSTAPSKVNEGVKKSAPMSAALYYRHYPESNTWRIDGPDDLLRKMKDVLEALWNPVAHAIVANAQQVGKLVAECERRKVPIRAYDAQREPGE